MIDDSDDLATILLSHVPDEPMRTHYTGCDKFHPACAMARAVDEIERLRGLVADLLPFAQADAELGATLTLCPDGSPRTRRWRKESVALLARIDKGEFT